jgi:hypothetical protein
MTALEDKLRTALRETARDIPDDPPPLRLSPGAAGSPRRRWIVWAAPVAAAAVVLAVIAGALTVTSGLPHRTAGPAQASPGRSAAARSSAVRSSAVQSPAPQSPAAQSPAVQSSEGAPVVGPSARYAPTGPDGLPPYYVALASARAVDEYAATASVAQVRETATGAVLASVAVPKPYAAFTGVTAAADDRTFVVSAQEAQPKVLGSVPGARFFVLRIAPDAAGGARMSLRALPAGSVPAGAGIEDMALSPDGTGLAADVGSLLGTSKLYLFSLATGTSRSWSYRRCAKCADGSGGLGFGGVNADALSWTADGRYLAFVGPGPQQGAVRVLDTRRPGSDLVANSRPLVGSPAGSGPYWRGALLTPDGRTVVVVAEIAIDGNPDIRQRLVKFSSATGKVTQVLDDLRVVSGYEQVLWSSPDGGVLAVAYLRGGNSMGILHGTSYTPIPWSPHIDTAAW